MCILWEHRTGRGPAWRPFRIAALAACAAGIVLGSSPTNLKTPEATKTSVTAGNSVRPLTVVDSIEARRVLNDYGIGPVLLSPDGKRYLVIVLRGDLAQNGSWIDLLSGSTASLEAAAKVRVVAHLFSRSTAQADSLIKNVRWLGDSEHVAFLWDGGQGLPKVVSVNVRTRERRTLARHDPRIVQYDVSLDGRTVVFAAQARRRRSDVLALGRSGFAVTHQTIWSLLQGDFDGWTPGLHYETFVSSPSKGAPRKIREPEQNWYTPPELLSLSPDGRYAIAVRPAGFVPANWDKYTEHVFRDDYLPAARRDPDGPNWIRQYVVMDLRHGKSWVLWDAPENPRGQVVWSPDGQSLLVGPTFLPAASANTVGLSGRAVAEVDVATGRFVPIPLPNDFIESGFHPASWTREGVIELARALSSSEDGFRLRFKKISGDWRPIPEEAGTEERQPPVRIELRQDPNTPPALYAVETRSSRSRLILDLNPQLRKGVTLGHVELVHWKATDGKPWTGMLYYPVHYEPGLRFPLVIQTHGYLAKDFSLDGGFTTVFAAQPLANRDVVVLQVGGPDSGSRDILATPREPEVFVSGIEGAIEHFTAEGLVDRTKVGIIGFSRTGWLVECLLTHSEVPLAAAEVADNVDGSFVQFVLAEGDLKAFYAAEKGADPFGSGLAVWTREAPGFQADKIRAPLRLELDSGPISEILTQWEMFSALRFLQKPVELYVIPDIEHGVHILQNPSQRLASQGASLDWFCFWLKDEEDPDPRKAGQYARWRELRKLQK